jgi:uncharacterized membrane protein YuzA (DUF378 family)
MIAYILVIIGALNWLLLGIFGWEIGQLFGGQMATISRIIYIVIGLAAINEMFTHKALCRKCNPSGSMKSSM